jgi:hypothetical protein
VRRLGPEIAGAQPAVVSERLPAGFGIVSVSGHRCRHACIDVADETGIELTLAGSHDDSGLHAV